MLKWPLGGTFSAVLAVACTATVEHGRMVPTQIPSAHSLQPVPGRAPGAIQSTPPQIERVQRWLKAVNDHQPGDWDAAAQTVSSWSLSELESLFPYVKGVVELVGQDKIKPGWGVFTGVEVEQLKNLAGEARGNDINNVMKRGALLHSDIAIMMQTESEPVPGPPPSRQLRSNIGARFTVPRRTTVIGDDGRYEGFGREAIHWEFARMLLDSVRPSPSIDGMVRLWYQAIAAYFADN